MIEEDHCVYVKRSKGDFAILSLYVDDILLAANSKEFVKTIIHWLYSNFDMKDMGEAAYILGSKFSEIVQGNFWHYHKNLTLRRSLKDSI